MKKELKNTKLLFIYRNIHLNSLEFNTKDKNLIKITKALNIKKRKKRIEYIYDEAVKEIEKYYSKDLCKFKNGQCILQRKLKTDRVNGCCRICPLITDKGCPTSNLPCKMIYCDYVSKKIKQLKYKDIDILKCYSIKQRLILKSNFFSTKEEIIKELNYGFLYSFLHEIKKAITMYIHRKKNKL